MCFLCTKYFGGGMRDVKYLHKSCNTKKSIHKMRNATSCVFSQSTVHKEREKIRLHKSIFIYFFILLFFLFLFVSSSTRKSFRIVLFTEWKIVLMSSTFGVAFGLTRSGNKWLDRYHINDINGPNIWFWRNLSELGISILILKNLTVKRLDSSQKLSEQLKV